MNSDLEQLVSAELSRFQRQLRVLQLELRVLLDNKTKKLKKQYNLITVLLQEHESLQNEINCLEKGTHAKKDFQKEQYLSELQNNYFEVQRLLKAERSNVVELSRHVKKTKKLVEQLHKTDIPDMLYKHTVCKIQKNVAKLENRLNVVNKKYCSVLTDNRQLRQSINHMLQDRCGFNDIWKSMVTQFNEGKKYTIELIDQSTLAYDQREELCTKLQFLKKRNENDQIVHIQEMREMQRRLEHDSKLQKFYDIKCQKRLNPELEKRDLNKKLIKKELIEKQIAERIKIIEAVKHLCEEEDITCLATKFTRYEDENFALFSYVNELSHEIEILNEAIIHSYEEIEHQKIQLERKALKDETEALDCLNEKLEKAQNDNVESKKNLEYFNLIQQQLLEGVLDLYKQLRGNGTPILNMLKSSTQLTSHNVKLYAGVIEKRINFIISSITKE